MTEEIRYKLEKVQAVLRKMRKDNSIDVNTYYKGMISIAYEYCVDGDLKETMLILNDIEDEYFTTAMAPQMQEDPFFLETAYTIATTLVTAGVVSDDEQFVITGKRDGSLN